MSAGSTASAGLVAIKPSGVPYEQLTPEKLAVVDLEGNQLEGKFKPSSDTPTHLELYRAFSDIGAVAHSHSHYATVWAPGPALRARPGNHRRGLFPR